MSTLSQFATGGIKSIQTGYVATIGIASGTGEEARYLDVTVSAVANIAKCLVTFNGSANTAGSTTSSSYNQSTSVFLIPTIRMLNSTTIRIMVSSSAANAIVGRWTLVEYF